MTAPAATPRPLMHPADSFALGFALTAFAIALVVVLTRRWIG